MIAGMNHKINRLPNLRLINILLFITISILLYPRVLFADIVIKATAEPTTIMVGESFSYDVEILGNKMTLPSPDVHFPSSFRVISGPNTSTNLQVINARMESSRSVNWILVAEKPGTFMINGPKVKVKRKTYQGPKVTIKVKMGTNARSQQGGSSKQGTGSSSKAKPTNKIRIQGQPEAESIFLDIRVDPQEVYLQQPVAVTYTLWYRENVRTFDVRSVSSTDGFWSEAIEVPNPPSVRQKVIDGKTYNTAIIHKLLLYPTRSGELSIGPMDIVCEVQKRQNRRRPGSLFDSFFDGYERVQKNISSEPVKVKVKQLPAFGRPENFDGLVGRYNINAKLDRDTVVTNESVTLKVTISGSGNIGFVPEPLVIIPPDIEKYDPEISENSQHSGGKMRGKKNFTYLLIPRRAGKQKIAPVSFSYFDPVKNKYVTDQTRELNLYVAPATGWAAAGNSAPGGSPEEVRSLTTDIRWIHESVKGLRRTNKSLYHSSLYPVSYLFPATIALLALWLRQRKEKLAGDVAGRKSRQARKHVAAALKEATTLHKENKILEGYTALARGLISYLADRTHNNTTNLDLDNIMTILSYRNISEELKTEFKMILEKCNTARFTPDGLDAETLNTLISKSRNWIHTADYQLSGKQKTAQKT